MNISSSENMGSKKLIGQLSKLALMGLMVFALVAFPCSFVAKSGWIGSSVVFADSGGDSGSDY